MTLAELLAEASSDLGGCSVDRAPDGGTTWLRKGRPFAAASADGHTAEFALDLAVAAAAARTPDVTPSARGPGWVGFTPVDLDDHAIDRAVAWLGSAHRRAGPRD